VLHVIDPISDALCGLQYFFIPTSSSVHSLTGVLGIDTTATARTVHEVSGHPATVWLTQMGEMVGSFPVGVVEDAEGHFTATKTRCPTSEDPWMREGTFHGISDIAVLCSGITQVRTGLGGIYTVLYLTVEVFMCVMLSLQLFWLCRDVLHIGR
jgi:hypothetical protein